VNVPHLIAGAGAGIALCALAWAGLRSSAAADDLVAAAAATQELAQLGAPDQALVTRYENAAKEQADAVAQAAILTPPLPESYRAVDLASATKKVRDDLEALRLRSDRLGIPLPRPLPFEGGLDSDTAVRGVQLAFLSAIRLAVDRCLDAGVARIGKLDTVRAWSDPSGSYACFAIDLEVEAPAAAIQALIGDLQQRPESGLALNRAHIEPGRADAAQKLALGLVLLTTNLPDWKLMPEALPRAPSTAPAKTMGKGLGTR
jgi:hypothetical protein